MRDGPRELDDRLAGALPLPPELDPRRSEEGARRRRAKVKVEEGARGRGGDDAVHHLRR